MNGVDTVLNQEQTMSFLMKGKRLVRHYMFPELIPNILDLTKGTLNPDRITKALTE